MGKASESSTLTYILEKFRPTLTGSDSLPIVIPNFGRDQLADLFCELGFSTGAEIGVKRGEYSEVLLKARDAARVFQINDKLLDFVYLDGAHDFQNIANDICEWSKVLRPGSILAGHDYVRRTHGRDGGPNTSHHIVPVVKAYTEAFGIDPWFLLGRKQARPGEVRDKERIYLWVKK